MIKHKREYVYSEEVSDPKSNREGWQEALLISNVLSKTSSVYGMFSTMRSLDVFKASIGKGNSIQRMVNLGELPLQVEVEIRPHPVKGFDLGLNVIQVKTLYNNFINNINKGGSYAK